MSSRFDRSTDGDEIVSAFAGAVRQKIFVITGPSAGGIGAETALSLARANPAKIILVGRNESKIAPVIEELHKISPSTAVVFVQTDFAALSAVRSAVDKIRRDVSHIDCLINNAGILMCPEMRSAEGFELQFATNHLAHFVLTAGLEDLIVANGRIVNLSSLGHWYRNINWDDINLEKPGAYMPEVAYAQSKTANILHAIGLAERLEEKRIRAYSVHPGSVATGLQTWVQPADRERLVAEMQRIVPNMMERAQRVTLQQGCATTLVAALDPSIADRSGAYLEDCQISEPAPYAADKTAAARLWTLTEDILKEAAAVEQGKGG